MNLPLYQGIQRPASSGKNGHHGLWFDRFFDRYENHDFNKVSKELGGWLDADFCNDPVGNQSALSAHALRQVKLTQDLGGRYCVYSLDWRFVTGMGNSHPIENGLSWHPTLGVPYLCGAAIKGLVRSVIELYGDYDEEEQKSLLRSLFGSTTKDTSDEDFDSGTGALLFFDAFPISPVKLGRDIMTPHAGKWYEQGGSESPNASTIPADWHDPVTISFLTVHKANFLFSFAPRQVSVRGNDAINSATLESTLTALSSALGWLGAGAKTAAGYGYMRPEKNENVKLEHTLQKYNNKLQTESSNNEMQAAQLREQRQQESERHIYLTSLSPFKRKLIALMDESNKDDPVKELQVRLVKKQEWKGDSQKEQEVAELIYQQWHDKGLWLDTDPVPGSKKKQRKLCKSIQPYLNLIE